MPISKMRNDTFKGWFIDTGIHQRPKLIDRPLWVSRRLLFKQTSQPGGDGHSSTKNQTRGRSARDANTCAGPHHTPRVSEVQRPQRPGEYLSLFLPNKPSLTSKAKVESTD